MHRLNLLLLMLLTSALISSASHAAATTPTDNLVAFARTVGYVRYFHPSDAVRETDWDAFTLAHLATVEAATTPADLAQTLNTLFTPYAPTLRLAVTGESVDLNLPDIADASTVLQWVHVPLTNGERNLRPLRPTLIQQPISAGDFARTYAYRRTLQLGGFIEMDVPVHDPRQPYVVDLAGGVTLHLPLAVFSDGERSLPLTDMESLPALPPTDTADARTEHLANTITAWNYFQHFFTYWEAVEELRGTDWLALLLPALDEAAAATSDYEWYQSLQRLTANLHDGHTTVFPPPELHSEWIERGWVANDALLPFTWDIVEDQLVITNVFEGSPLAVGDIVLAVDGVAPADHIAEQRQYLSPVNEYAHYRILNDWLSVRQRESIALTVQRVGAETSEIVDVAPSDQTLTNLPDFQTREPRPETLDTLDDGIMYLDLTRVADVDFNEYARAIEANAQGLVVDMRGYPNGRAAIRTLGAIAGRDLSSAPFLVGLTVEPDHRDFLFFDITPDNWVQRAAYDFPEPRRVAFITNSNGAISYAESIMGIVEGHQLGQIVGSRTAGANGNVAIVYLPNGFRITFTSLMVTKFDGAPLMTVGILPTLPVERTLAGVAAGRDELLEAAFTAVGGETLRYNSE